MGKMGPCCILMSLQKGAKFISVIEMFASIACIIFYVIQMGMTLTNGVNHGHGFPNHQKPSLFTWSIPIIFLAVNLIEFGLAVLLFRGAQQRCLQKCRIWFWATLIIFMIFLGNMISSLAFNEETILGFVISIINIIYDIYKLWLVYVFIKEMKIEAENGFTITTISPPIQSVP